MRGRGYDYALKVGSMLGPPVGLGSSVKYMLMMFGDATEMMEVRSQEWVRDMISFMGEFNARLVAAGEFVDAQGLEFPSTAKTVSLTDGQVVVSEGPFAE